MMTTVLLVLLAFVSFIAAQQYNTTVPSLTSFNLNEAQTSVWLSAAAACSKDAYMTHTFKGPSTGYVVTYVIYDSKTDTQGYIGYLPSNKSIYVVFRGSISLQNWITDLDAVKTDYTSFPECKCQVHKGFYVAEQKVIGGVIQEVTRLKNSKPDYALKVTGHSLGGALAQLTSMDLFKAGFSPLVYNFGQPRTGDQNYAKFATDRVTTWRVTHNKDMVPHLPATTGMDFYHVCREEWEDANGNLKTCDTTCEDKTCADQFKLSQTNTDDHIVYLGLDMNCAAVSR